MQDPSAKPGVGQGLPKTDTHVVFVHGIGQTRRGEILIDWGNALAEGLTELKGEALPTLSITSGLENEPAWATYPQWNLTMSESWWEELFVPPGFWKLVLWSASSLPETLVGHFDSRLRRASYWYESQWTVQEAVTFVVELCILLIGLVLTPLVVLLLLLLVPLAIWPSLRSFVLEVQTILARSAGDSLVFTDSRLLREALIQKIQRDILRACDASTQLCVVVAHSQGAAITHEAIRRMDRPQQRRTVFVSVGSGLNKLSALNGAGNSSKAGAGKWSLWGSSATAFFAGIVIVLQSWFGQTLLVPGRRVTSALATVGLSLLVCLVGMGLRMLIHWALDKWMCKRYAARQEFAARLANWSGWICICLIAFIATHWPTLWSWYAASCSMLLGLSFTLLMDWRYEVDGVAVAEGRRRREERNWKERFELPSLWWDFYATSDPVPNGPMFDRFKPERGFDSIPIVSRLSLVGDHSSSAYFANAEFKKALAAIVAGEPLPDRPEPPPWCYPLLRVLTIVQVAVWSMLAFDHGWCRGVRQWIGAGVDSLWSPCDVLVIAGNVGQVCRNSAADGFISATLALALFGAAMLCTQWLLRKLFLLGLRSA